MLEAHPTCQTPSVQSLALTGLSGIGKTQIAIEYAYRVCGQGQSPHVLWINAANEGTILTSFVTIAHLLSMDLTPYERKPDALVADVLCCVEQKCEPWLMIIDNADNLELIQAYLPHSGNGRLLLTTQVTAVGMLALPIEVDCMEVEDGIRFLLHRARRLDTASPDEVAAARQIVLTLGQFPLALDQAGAYIEETGCSIATYLRLYQDHHQTLLARRGNAFTNHPNPVATTWSFSFQCLEQRNPAAAQLLRLSAFLSPHPLPEEFIRQGAAYWPSALQQAIMDPLAYNQLFQDLLAFSLVKRLSSNRLISVHHLVQVMQIDQMGAAERYEWAKQIIRAMHTLFPRDSTDMVTRSHCLRYLGQVEAYTILMQQQHLEAAEILAWASSHLAAHELYHIAEPLMRKAFSIREQRAGLLHPDTIQSLSDLAFLYTQQGKERDVRMLYEHLVRAWKGTGGSPHRTIVDMHIHINALFAHTNSGLTQEHQERLTRFLTSASWHEPQAQHNVEVESDTMCIVRKLRAQGVSIREIARRVGIARNTVRKYVRTESPSTTGRSPRQSVLDPYKSQIRTWIAEDGACTRKELFIRLKAMGYTGSLSTLNAFVHYMQCVEGDTVHSLPRATSSAFLPSCK
ncbi:hypothetical protein KDH_11400 [Dictyobacter sp. S3.2.2.5]|uniref:HTH IS21-type domain-containing protein n=1 Tax=Dictyobacter halimunensis TaxID=3026934 RepID=A0ABQ6FPE5_9CHLR|nr:hypothetical protein KDH_11400 [Dictyobacter sp. S3.2.2.5]